MLQRIQSIYLLLTVILSTITLCLPLGTLTTDNGLADIYFYGYALEEKAVPLLPLVLGALLLIVIIAGSAAIFLFKHRKVQLKIANLVSVMLFLFFATFVGLTQIEQFSGITPNWTIALPFASLIFVMLAKRGIIKDENLIKAADRIR